MSSPYLQLVPVVIIYVTFIVLVLRYQCFASRLYFLTMLVNEVVYAVVLTCYFFFNIVKDSMSLESRRLYFGYGLIVICGLNIIFNVIVGIIELVKAIRNWCKKK